MTYTLMEDDKLKDLFGRFNPELSSDSGFMARLQRNMDAVEFVKRQRMAVRRRNKTAVVVAALSGFVTGMICALIFPLIKDWLSAVSFSIPCVGVDPVTVDVRLISLICMALGTSVIVYNAYVLTLSKLSMKETASQYSHL